MRHLKNSGVAILLDRRQETGMNASFGEIYRAKSKLGGNVTFAFGYVHLGFCKMLFQHGAVHSIHYRSRVRWV
jgi:hypothetical protein